MVNEGRGRWIVTKSEEKSNGNPIVNTIFGILIAAVIAGCFVWIMNWLLTQ